MQLRFKKHFNIPKSTEVDFINIAIDDSEDKIFICPFMIANDSSAISRRIYNQLVNFLQNLNTDFIMPDNKPQGILFLGNLHEPNEYHFGYSSDNKGKAIAPVRANRIFDALRNNRFTKQSAGITNEAHNVLLLVDGIGRDIMSDIIANVCRNIFAEFTKEQCRRHNIPTNNFTFHFYNIARGNWESANFELPEYRGKPIMLVPKQLGNPSRSYTKLYNWFIAKNRIAIDILNGKQKVSNNSKTVRIAKDGSKRVITKEVYKEFKKPKSRLVDFVITYKGSLDDFLIHLRDNFSSIDFSHLE